MRPAFFKHSNQIIVHSEFGLEIWSQGGKLTALTDSTLAKDSSVLTCIDVSSDGNHILAGTNYGNILRWDIRQPRKARNIPVGVTRGSTRIIGLSIVENSHCLVLLQKAILLVNYESSSAQVLEGAIPPANPGGVACSPDFSLIAISSPTEIILYSISTAEAVKILRIGSLIGHLQCPHTMVFSRDNTLFSCDAKVRGALRWKISALKDSDDSLGIQYCNACWTTQSTIDEIIPNGLFALLIHKDRSISVWRIDTDAKVQSFEKISCRFLFGRVVTEKLFRVAYVQHSGEVVFGDISFAEASWAISTSVWIPGADKDKKYGIEQLNLEKTGSSLPEHTFEMTGIVGAVECSSNKGTQASHLEQALSTGDQSEFERFLRGNTKEFVSQCVQSIEDHQVEALIRSLSITLQRPENNVECLAVAIIWVETILETKKSVFLRMDQSRRKTLLSPIRVILNEFAHLEDCVHSFHCRLRCIHQLQCLYIQKHDERSKRKQPRKRYYFRLT